MGSFKVPIFKAFFVVGPLFMGSFFSVFNTEYLKHILALGEIEQALFASFAFCFLGFWWSVNWRFYEQIDTETSEAEILVFVSKTTLPLIAFSQLLNEAISLILKPKGNLTWFEHVAMHMDSFDVLVSGLLCVLSAVVVWYHTIREETKAVELQD
ncbi:hypothetical protein KI743_06500 [Vibrio sp. D420a]|uniref:hypothetical protein n=1 Tax=Vibrio sp. D420a TaxID=2836895 RepID=UPI002553B228|nr:hypothetical protein [Vibrio sp. D420a]MDK9761644.1 hypothetical protein [Vibrio sp. D420a]